MTASTGQGLRWQGPLFSSLRMRPAPGRQIGITVKLLYHSSTELMLAISISSKIQLSLGLHTDAKPHYEGIPRARGAAG